MAPEDQLRFNLSQSDVTRLLEDPSAESRAEMARKVGSTVGAEGLSQTERKLAEDILRAMVRDTEVRVRQALSDSLKNNPDVPHDVVVKLATDEAAVAVPVLECSQVLSDDDLVEIVRTQSEDAQIAVARRETVSEPVAEALADTHNEVVVAELVANEGADISEQTFQKVLDEFGESERVNGPMARRQRLPISVAERLVVLVSDSLRDHLMTHHELPAGLASDLVLESRERATVGLLLPDADESDVGDLVEQLYANGRLTPSIVLRALCMGDIVFFEESLAKLARVPVASARILIYDQGALGLNALYGKAGLPNEFLPVVRVAVEVAQELEYDGRPGDRERLRQSMISRVLTHFESGFDGENLEYLVAKLGYREHAQAETTADRS
jgi:uncharacterized protein (DUF2336 family)